MTELKSVIFDIHGHFEITSQSLLDAVAGAVPLGYLPLVGYVNGYCDGYVSNTSGYNGVCRKQDPNSITGVGYDNAICDSKLGPVTVGGTTVALPFSPPNIACPLNASC